VRTRRRTPVEADDVEAELCIIGAGPAGLTIARELDGSDMRICLLESGGEELDRRVQRQSRGRNEGYPLPPLHRSRVRAVGGTLRHPDVGEESWAVRPLDPIDFEPRSGLPGWPFDREQLDIYYPRAHLACGFAAADTDPAGWPDEEGPLLPLDETDVETGFFRFVPATFHHAWGELRRSGNVQLFPHSRVVDLVVGPTSRSVDEVLVRRSDGSRFVVRARVVVLATGGVENARMLLATGGGRGLGNEHDLVGRYFAERLSTHAGHIVATRPTLVEDTALYRIHTGPQGEVCGVLRVRDEIQRKHQLLNSAFWMVPGSASITTDAVRSLGDLRRALSRRPAIEDLGTHLGNLLRGRRELADYVSSRRNGGPRVLAVRAQAEQTPNPDSRVLLDTRCDEVGMPLARVRWRIDESDWASLRASLELLDAALRERGVGRIEGMPGDRATLPLVEGNHHHMGTTRMHADPRQGVVDADCRVHSVPNLYVAGSSVFPTYGSSNPTLTIVALALRLADHLRKGAFVNE
jgi:choline dehydrogenase-like flavoprotein